MGSNDHTSASLFFSKCASEPFITRRKYPQKILVSELKQELKRLGYSSSGKKKDLVARLQRHIDDLQEHTADFDATRLEEMRMCITNVCGRRRKCEEVFD